MGFFKNLFTWWEGATLGTAIFSRRHGTKVGEDQLGNLYLADCFAGRVQKFEPLPNAEPDKMAGQILRTWDTWKP